MTVTVGGMVFTGFDSFPLRWVRGLPDALRRKERDIVEDARVLSEQGINFGFPFRV